MNKIRIVLNPKQRQEHIDKLLKLDGLSHIKEDAKAAYCPISLTQTPDELKAILQSRQRVLMQDVLEKNKIKAYDPASAPYSPDVNLTSLPNEVYTVDSAKIAGARYFVGHNLTASTGFGTEFEKAKMFNRISVILFDKKIRVSRMQPHRTICLQYDNFEKQKDKFAQVFKLIKNFDPGMGFQDQLAVLLGFDKKTKEVVNLEELVYKSFPSLCYQYDGTASIINLKAENPELFYEFNQ